VSIVAGVVAEPHGHLADCRGRPLGPGDDAPAAALVQPLAAAGTTSPGDGACG